MISSIIEKRKRIDKEAEDFLRNNGVEEDLYFWSFGGYNQERYEADVYKFKLLFDNGYEVALWNSLLYSVNIEALKQQDFSISQWAFLLKICNTAHSQGKPQNINEEIKTERLFLSIPTEERKELFARFFKENEEAFFEYTSEEYEDEKEDSILCYKVSHLF